MSLEEPKENVTVEQIPSMAQLFKKTKKVLQTSWDKLIGKLQDPIMTHTWEDDRPFQGSKIPKKPLPPSGAGSIAIPLPKRGEESE